MKRLTSLLLILNLVIFIVPLQGFAVEKVEISNDMIFMKVGENYGYAQGNKIPISIIEDAATPFVFESVNFVPVEFMADCLEIITIKNDIEKSISFEKGNNKITIYAGKDTYDCVTKTIANTPYPEVRYTKTVEKCTKAVVLKKGILYAPLDMLEKSLSIKTYTDGDLLVASTTDIDSKNVTITNMKTDFATGNLLSQDVIDNTGVAFINESDWEKSEVNAQNNCGTSEVSTEEIGGQIQNKITVTTKSKPSANYGLRQKYKLTSTIKENDLCLISFYAKGIEGENPRVNVIVEQSDRATHYKSLAQEVQLTNEWKRYDFPFVSRLEHMPNNTSFYIAFGFEPQKVEVANLRTYNFQKQHSINQLPQCEITYDGGGANAPWRQEAILNIDANRKKTSIIKVIDDKGIPIQNATVTAISREDEFNFGTSVGQAYVTGTAQGADATSNGLTAKQNCAKFNETLKKYFNTAIPENALKWPLWVNRKENSKLCFEKLVENGLRTRGHVLYWDSWDYAPQNVREKYGSGTTSAGWILNDIDGFDTAVKTHITEMAREYKDKVVEWDVLNEAVRSRDSFLKDTSIGNENYIKGWFDAARAADPDARLYINEMLISGEDDVQYKKFNQLVNKMIIENVDFDGIGMQSHFGSNPESPGKFLAQVNELTGKGKFVEVTEYDMLSTSENLQARFLKDMMIAAFSNENVTGFNMWGHWDGDHWRRNSPMFRRDWSIKPAGQMWQRLRNNVFSTNVEGVTNENGEYSPKLINGTYDVTVSIKGIPQTQTLVFKDGSAKTIIYRNNKAIPFVYDYENRQPGEVAVGDAYGYNDDGSVFKMSQWGGWTKTATSTTIVDSNGEQGIVTKITSPAKSQNDMEYDIPVTEGKKIWSFAFKTDDADASRWRTFSVRDSNKLGAEIVKIKPETGNKFTMQYFGTYDNQTKPDWHFIMNIAKNTWYYFNFVIDPVTKTFDVYTRSENQWEWSNIANNGKNGVGKLPDGFNNSVKNFIISEGFDNNGDLKNGYYDDFAVAPFTQNANPIISTVDKNGSVPIGTTKIGVKYNSVFICGKIPEKSKMTVTKTIDNHTTNITDYNVKVTHTGIEIDFGRQLTTNASYKITFNECETIFAGPIAPIEFFVDKSPIMASSITVKVGDKTIRNMSDITPGSTVTYTFNENANYSKKITYAIYAAVYKNNQLDDLKVKNTIFNGTNSIKIDLIMPNEPLDNYKIKYFIWDVPNNLPLLTEKAIEGAK